MKKIAILLFFHFHFFSFVEACEIWFEDNNLAKPAYISQEAKNKFQTPEKWEKARKSIQVYILRANVILNEENAIDDVFLKNYLAPVLIKDNIKIALDVGGATWMHAAKERENIVDEEMALIKKMKEYGLKIDSVNMQSVLSKDMKNKTYSLQQRIDDVVEYSQRVVSVFPDIKIGIIDALPSKGKEYKKQYEQLQKSLKNKNIRLNHIILDMPFEIAENGKNGMDWQKVKEVEDFVKQKLNISFGLVYTSKKAGHKSDKAFHDTLLTMYKRYKEFQGNPDYCVMMSWFPYPKCSVDDGNQECKFNEMQNVLDFKNALDNYQW